MAAHFTDAPPITDRAEQLRIVRTPTKGKLTGIVLSERMLWTKIHYAGRSLPCTYVAKDPKTGLGETRCASCDAGNIARSKGYILIMHPTNGEQVIFEMTDKGFPPFDKWFTEHGTTRGCMFTSERVNQKANGKLHIRCQPEPWTAKRLPPALDIRAALNAKWEYNANKVVEYRESQFDATLLDAEERGKLNIR